MRSKIVAVCAVAALAIPALSATSLGCDKETRQAAAKCGSEKTAAVEAKAACSKSEKAAAKTVAARTSCSKSKQAAATTVAAGTSGSSCSKSKKAATTVAAGTGDSCSKSKESQTVTLVAAGTGSACCAKAEARTAAAEGKACPAERTMQLVVRALRDSRNCGPDCAARSNLVAALRTMAKANPQLACETMLAAMTCESGPRPAQARVAAAGCDAPCGTKARNVAAADAACDPAACASKRAAAVAGAACGTKTSDAACGTQARTIAGSACGAGKQPAARQASAGSACDASKARYVAFGCEKTDSVARAAAQAYLQVMRAIKRMTGAEGCAAKAASNVLASVLDDLSPQRAADARAEKPAVETATVSLGAVSDDAKKSCGDAEAN